MKNFLDDCRFFALMIPGTLFWVLGAIYEFLAFSFRQGQEDTRIFTGEVR